MATPPEHQYEAALALAPKVSVLLSAARTYLRLLGDDHGKTARLVRRSHFGVIQPAVADLVDEWRRREAAVYEERLGVAFANLTLTELVAGLENASGRAVDVWDNGVREIEKQASALDGVLRSFLQREQAEPSIPGYELLGELGRGGFGAVYKARDSAGVHRAVKVLAPSALAPQEHAADRFRREGELLAAVEHPGIVRYLHLVNGVHATYLVMELIDGRRLSDWARDQDDVTRVEAVVATLEALQHLHDRAVIHRDLKPSNILVEEATGRVVVVDLGLAWLVGDPAATMTHASAWSAAYAPPEVLADPRASRGPKHDLYSMGVVLYEILVGQRPLLVNRVPLGSHREELKPLDVVIDRALAPEPGRFSTATEFVVALREALVGIASPWHAVHLAAGRVRSEQVRSILIEAAERASTGNVRWAALVTAGLADALRIHYTRAYRIARGSDGPRLEARLPARLSVPASVLFPKVGELCTEPVLAEDKYGEAAVARLGFSVGDLQAFDLATRLVLKIANAPRDKSADPAEDPEPETLVNALCSLAAKFEDLERAEPALVRSFAKLAAAAQR